jgi:uncharacterized membrane protein
MLDADAHTLWLIFVMGVTIYATRLAGFWVLQGKVISGRYRAAIDAVPAAILTAVIAPTVFLSGPAEMAAGAIALFAAVKKMPLLVVIALGVGSVALFRLVM